MKKVKQGHKTLSLRRQCELLCVHPSGLYYKPRGESGFNLYLMRIIDERYLKKPFWGVPRMTHYINQLGIGIVSEKRIARLYRLLNIKAIAPGPHTSRSHPEHKKYPYLLRDMKAQYPGHVWATDITCVPMRTGYMYLTAIMDVHSRYIVNWSLSNTMEAQWCTSVLTEAIATHGAPQIFNSDQGSQYTSELHTGELKKHGIKISMDGRGRALDNIFIERFWRTIKYEHLKLTTYSNGLELYREVEKFMNEYNHHRMHQSLDYKTPASVYQSKYAA
ncbi:MAG: IS3 family transposase [Flavobacteriales bacterium]